ncbi:hypothetical protein BpHYR1_029383 [Brachionus plicatilis]|uniref:Uncharacterized protein n=1 Tax=Brachionus plicatilis TaxID=10195 RepID=A0A3M7PAI1_BRAPC|nr:hypothetical protein BpHYR1_029383 [Brachionus plicatilis]
MSILHAVTINFLPKMLLHNKTLILENLLSSRKTFFYLQRYNEKRLFDSKVDFHFVYEKIQTLILNEYLRAILSSQNVINIRQNNIEH